MNNSLKKCSNITSTIFHQSELIVINDSTKNTTRVLNDTTNYNVPFLAQDVCYNKDLDLIIATGKDGILKFYDRNSNERINFIPIGKEDRIILTPENYYWATKGALDGVGYTIKGKAYSFDQFDLVYNRPDKVIQAYSGSDDELIAMYTLAYEKRIKKLGLSQDSLMIDLTKTPEIILDFSDVPSTVKEAYISVPVSIRDSYVDLQSIHCQINGVPVFEKSLPEISGANYSGKLDLELSKGANLIQISASNKLGIESLKQEFNIFNETKKNTKPNAYIVTIGVSEYKLKGYNLKYAHKDASDIIKTFEKSAIFNKVYTQMFIDSQVDTSIISTITEFVSGATVNDIVIVFYAGHGLLDEELNYYLASYNTEFSNPRNSSILYADLENILSNTKSRKKVLLLDACHSGEIDKEEVTQDFKEVQLTSDALAFRGGGTIVINKTSSIFELSKTLFADLRENNGSFVISSAGGAEYAIEGDAWNNGLFTFALINGLANKEADLNKDKKIMMSELQKYILDRVANLSNGRQIPTSRVENLKSNFRIW